MSRKNNMKNTIIQFTIAGLLAFAPMRGAFAEATVYKIRVDGLACPYCAYGIEKKFNKINGVKFINMDLDKGVVTVKAQDVKLEEPQLKKLFEDSGFTYRSKQESTQ